MITMPVSGMFKMQCSHCRNESPNEPLFYKQTAQDMSIYECPKCHELTLIRFSENVCSLFEIKG